MNERATFDHGRDAPRLARRTVDGWLEPHVDPPVLGDVALLVSELVTNAVRHAGANGRIDVAVSLRDGRVRVEVSDPGSGFHKPKVGEPPPDALGGRGLLIVDRLARRWGVGEGPTTLVWFELDARAA